MDDGESDGEEEEETAEPMEEDVEDNQPEVCLYFILTSLIFLQCPQRNLIFRNIFTKATQSYSRMF